MSTVRACLVGSVPMLPVCGSGSAWSPALGCAFSSLKFSTSHVAAFPVASFINIRHSLFCAVRQLLQLMEGREVMSKAVKFRDGCMEKKYSTDSATVSRKKRNEKLHRQRKLSLHQLKKRRALLSRHWLRRAVNPLHHETYTKEMLMGICWVTGSTRFQNLAVRGIPLQVHATVRIWCIATVIAAQEPYRQFLVLETSPILLRKVQTHERCGTYLQTLPAGMGMGFDVRDAQKVNEPSQF
eukprot:1156169-Pelagomonas_calceolata.AAC.4